MKYTNHLHRNNITLAIIVLAWIFRQQITNELIGFLLTGALPGLSISVPYWAMLLFYVVAIASVVMFYFSRTADAMQERRQQDAKRTAMPRRRYGNI